jgi:hypothetical protein
VFDDVSPQSLMSPNHAKRIIDPCPSRAAAIEIPPLGPTPYGLGRLI